MALLISIFQKNHICYEIININTHHVQTCNLRVTTILILKDYWNLEKFKYQIYDKCLKLGFYKAGGIYSGISVIIGSAPS
ncbi:7728_t:CDS:2, partial [Entrophospora sp. SA101]